MDASEYQAPEVDRAMDAPELHRVRYEDQAPEAYDKGDIQCDRSVCINKNADDLKPKLMSKYLAICPNKIRRLHGIPDDGAVSDLVWPYGLALLPS